MDRVLCCEECDAWPSGVSTWRRSICDPVCFLPARSYEYVLEPSPVPLPLDRPQETRVLQVACGRAHSLVLTDQEGGEWLGEGGRGWGAWSELC